MIDTSRREIVAGLALLGLLPGGAAMAADTDALLGPPTAFSWDALQRRAATLARQSYQAPVKVGAASAIGFDAVGSIRYKADKTLAGGIRLFPVAETAPAAVAINIVEQGRARPVRFTPDLFETTARAASSSATTSALGIAGFRAVTPNGQSDWIAFLGASYFRAAGSQDQYGLSARGIAIDTGIDGREAFPAFTEFWIERTGDQAYTIYALLDGESITGAYRFVSRHAGGVGQGGVEQGGVEQRVSSVLYLRRDIARLGIAPATSMFWYGEGNRTAAADWRPEIHDSDGLALHTGSGERIWRPLENPRRATLDSFQDDNPRGFGLLQRDRAFDHYQDDGAFYDRRPNLWVEPQGNWGKGAVTLFAFPTQGETIDNIVAFWTPAAPARRGQRLQFDYVLKWQSADPTRAATAQALDVWRGVAGRPGDAPVAGARKIVVDFLGDGLAGLDRSSGVVAKVDVVRGRLLASAAYPVVGQANRWRVTADVAPASADAACDIRLFLQRGGVSLSETVLTQLL